MTKPKTDKSSSEILAEQEIQRLEENEAEIIRLKKQMKPKIDKQGWVDELYRLDVGDPDSKGCTISLGEYLRTDCPELEDFISDLLSLQREEVRREVVEEVRDWIEQNRDERPDKLFSTDSKGGNYELGRRDENIVLINELVKILDKLALSSDGEKKGTK